MIALEPHDPRDALHHWQRCDRTAPDWAAHDRAAHVRGPSPEPGSTSTLWQRVARVLGGERLLAATMVATMAALVAGSWLESDLGRRQALQAVTTLLAVVMVLLLQYAERREHRAMQRRLDDLLVALGSVRRDLLDLKELSAAERGELRSQHALLSDVARHRRTRILGPR